VAEHLEKRASSIRIENLPVADAVIGHVPSSNRTDKIGRLFGNPSEAQGGFCTRNCARMTRFLLVYREDRCFREKTNFPLVNRSFFETKRSVLKSTISES
jgi:hypothetical protein